MIQGSDEWLQARVGCITASRIADIMSKGKGGAESASRAEYKAQLVAERMTGVSAESGYMNDAMRWGTEQEPFARAAYEMERGVMVDQVGLVMLTDTTITKAGASPDGLVGDNGLVEIKCPKTSTHIEYLRSQSVPSKYKPQMAWQIICTGRKWCDFVSYDPRMPEHLRLFIKRFEPSDEYLREVISDVECFDAQVQAIIKELEEL